MGRQPLTRQNSPWIRDMPTTVAGLPAAAWHRSVSDGKLTALITREPHGLHLSIAHHNHPSRKGRAIRYPTWDEIAGARYGLCPTTIDMVMILPAEDDYVMCHPTAFHLHQIDNLPPSAVDRPR